MRTQKNTPIWLQEYRQPYAKHFSIFNLRSTYLHLVFKNAGFIAQMINLFINLYYRNRRYGNDHYDKTDASYSREVKQARQAKKLTQEEFGKS